MKKTYNFHTLTIQSSSTYTLSEWKRLCKGHTATLYVIKLFDDTDTFIKVGRTSKTLKMRFSTLPYSYTLLYAERGTPTKIFNLENKLHKLLKSNSFSHTPSRNFSGDTECYDLEAIFLLSETLDFHYVEKKD